MGWCSGTDIFDSICSILLDKHDNVKITKTTQNSALLLQQTVLKQSYKEILSKTIDALHQNDWDCEQDSEYWEHPLVQEIFKEKFPDWFEEEK